MNCTASSFTMDAKMNWWGSQSGPYHPTINPDGSGDNVSDNVDFMPWLGGEPVNHPPVIEGPFEFNLKEDIWFSHKFNASDPDMDPIAWSFRTSLAWLSWDADSMRMTYLDSCPTIYFKRFHVFDRDDRISEFGDWIASIDINGLFTCQQRDWLSLPRTFGLN